MGSWSCIILGSHADVAELVDALASGASVRKYVKVQVLSSAPELICLILSKVAKGSFQR